uniref:Uncharacterized protein n=1 Tax=Amphimedon queenslandica TaxID=400682 RepID=A0A1X7ST87_AMPQE
MIVLQIDFIGKKNIKNSVLQTKITSSILRLKDLIVSPPQKEHFHQRTLPLPPSPPPLLHLYQNHL